MRSFFALVGAFLAFVGMVSATFDMQMANTSVWYCAASSCDPNTYSTHTYKGPTSGFTWVASFDGGLNDINGYLGYQSSKSLITVVFRGTESINNWLVDFDAIKVNYPYCSGCEVHKGFYNALNSVWGVVSTNIKNLHAKFPTYKVLVTGHSLGGAVSTLAAMELINQGIVTPSYVYNFGSPRVGNTQFANFVATKIPGFNRVTHYNDIVPHVPYNWMGYEHVVTEYYEDQNHVIHTCTGNEDTNCMMQWNTAQCSTDAHLLYLNLDMHCAAVS